MRIDPAPLAWMVAVAPFVVVPLGYWWSVEAGHAPLCWPPLEGCTSISRAMRNGPAHHLFTAVMLPLAGLTGTFWLLVYGWLRRVRPQSPSRSAVVLALGLIASLFLVLYATFLGVPGEPYQWLRRYGVTVYFSFTVLAQMLLVSLMPLSPWRGALAGACAAMLLMGLASLPLQYGVADDKALLNSIEWAYAALMTSGFGLVALAWRKSGFALRVELHGPHHGP